MKKILLICALLLMLTIGGALADASDFTYTKSASSVTITGYRGGSSMVIPDEIDGLPVTAIAANAFLDQSSILSAELPETLISIGDSAFSGCWKMKTLTMKEGLVSIGNRAFYECAGITALNFPASLRTIGEYAFYNVNKIYSDLVLPEKLESVGLYAFGKSSFTGIVMPVSLAKRYAEGTTYTAGVLYHIFYRQYLEIESVKLIGEGDVGEYAFSGYYSVKSLDLSEAKIGAIGNRAFSGTDITGALTLSAPLRSIGDAAFKQCYKITSLTLPQGLESIGEEAFYGSSHTALSLPSSLRSIGAKAFYNCDDMTSLKLSEGLVSVGEQAFYGCKKVTGPLVIPSTVTYAGEWAFYTIGTSGTSQYTEVTIPAALTAMASATEKKSCMSAIFGMQTITTVNLTGGGRLADYAFYKESKITSINMSGSSVTEIGDYAMYDCYGMKSVSLPPRLNSIGDYAFYGCWGLPAIDLPDTLRTLGVRCFYDCEKIKKIVIPEGITEIPDYAFFKTGITDFTFPQSIRRFGEGVIDAYTTLTSLRLPDYVEEINVDAFPGDLHLQCSLGSRTSRAITKMIYADTGEDQAEITDPAHPGIVFRTDLEGEGIVTKLISIKSSEKHVVVPEGIHKIWTYAIDALDNMETLRLPSTYQNIYTYAIRNCPRLTSITFPQSASGAIGMYAVSGCSSLESVVIGRGVTYIADNAFDAVPQTVYCYAGSDAEKYARKIGAQIVHMEDDNPDGFVQIRSDLSSIIINENETKNLTGRFSAYPLPMGSEEIVLSSINPERLMVSGFRVTGGEPGDTALRAALAGNPRVYTDIPVHVRRLVTDFTLPEVWVSAGCSVKLAVGSVFPADADREFTWSLPDGSLARISGDTLTAGNAIGTQTLTAVSFNGVARTTTLHVCAAVNSIRFETAESSMYCGDTYALRAYVTAGSESLVNELVEFTSLNEHVATVDRHGVVTAHNAGMARICARAESGAIAYMTMNVRAIDSVNLPQEIRVIGAEAFSGMNAEQIVVPADCLRIEAGAFAGCSRLVRVKILGSDTMIEEGAFDEDAQLTFFVPQGSRAQVYAKAQGYAVEIIDP